jgi:hypothetical protein
VQPLALAIVSEDKSLPAGWPQEVEQNADGGGFTGAVESEEAEYLAGCDVQVEIVYRYEFAVLLRESSD